MSNVNNSKKPWAPLPEKSESVRNPKSAGLENPEFAHQDRFMSALESEYNSIYNELNDLVMTENGALGYKTSGSKLLDINFSISSLRNVDDKTIYNKFRDAAKEDFRLALKWLFFARDIREGVGERNLFRVCIRDLAENCDPMLMKELINLIPEYGRWDDLLVLLDTPLKNDVLNLIKRQMSHDYNEMKAGRPITLLAKWLPSENATSQMTRKNAKIICNYLNISPRKYRKQLSEMRKYLDVVERKMSSDNWQAIDYEKVPSIANLKYKDAFMRHDFERRQMYLDALKSGEAKINSSVANPPQIVSKYNKLWTYNYYYGTFNGKIDETLEAMWKALPDCVNGNSNTLVVADGSGSMTCLVSGKMTALDVANAMAIYFAERAAGPFKNKYITFSSKPQLVTLDGENLMENIAIALKHDECSNTNIEKTFDLILNTAIDNHLDQKDLPENVLIISDMEFDYATCGNSNDTLFKTISNKFEEAGYRIPRLIFWNVISRTGAIPVRENKLGVALVSGFSQNVLKMIMSEELDPYKVLVETLNSPRYDAVDEAIDEVIKARKNIVKTA